jgi:hypothetical protein
MYNQIPDSIVKYLELISRDVTETDLPDSPITDDADYQLGLADGRIELARRIIDSLK